MYRLRCGFGARTLALQMLSGTTIRGGYCTAMKSPLLQPPVDIVPRLHTLLLTLKLSGRDWVDLAENLMPDMEKLHNRELQLLRYIQGTADLSADERHALDNSVFGNGRGDDKANRTSSVNAQALLERCITEWHFDVRTISGETEPLQAMIVWSMHNLKLAENLHISTSAIQLFSEQVLNHHQHNPYHNAEHTASVLHYTIMMLTRGSCLQQLAKEPLRQHLILFAVIVIASLHDVGHTGTTNNYLIRTEHDLATIYNDKSPLENHHASLGWRVLCASGILASFSTSSRMLIRRLFISTILMTDLSQQLNVLTEAQVLMQRNTCWSDPAALPTHRHIHKDSMSKHQHLQLIALTNNSS